jgi:beta-N-acetylhexosaminidase
LSNGSLGSPLAAIFGCEGLTLSAEEAEFFKGYQPIGFILFQRNIDTPDQVCDLVHQLRTLVGRTDAPILIDQEGGRVARLGPPHWPELPPAARFGLLAVTNADAAHEAVHAHGAYIGCMLSALGISVNCAPILDLAVDGAHSIIGDRAFSNDVSVVASLGRAYCDGMLASGLLPVVKHIPGHGRATVDSHQRLPLVETSHSLLCETDFSPFQRLADMPLAMTAHVAYMDIDGSLPATFSAKVIEDVIRTELGFSGLLISDDISMQALETFCPKIGERAITALQAGCDLILHCNGDMVEMKAVAAVCESISASAQERWLSATNMALSSRIADLPQPEALATRRDNLLAQV